MITVSIQLISLASRETGWDIAKDMIDDGFHSINFSSEQRAILYGITRDGDN